MYFLAALVCLILGVFAIEGARRIRVPQGPQEELLGLARAGLFVNGALLLLGALVLTFLAVRPPG